MRNSTPVRAGFFFRVVTVAVVTCSAATAAPPRETRAGAGPGSGPGDAGAIAATVRDDATFDKVLERIRAAEASGVWQKGGWKDPVIEAALTGLVEQMSKATGRNDLAPAVTLADVQPRDLTVNAGPAQNALWVCRGGSVGFADHSIILADGSLSVGFANDCVIVARGAVDIAHGNHNVVLAGHYIHVSHDGEPLHLPNRGPGGSSLLVTGGSLDISHATGTVCSAPRFVRMGFAEAVTLVNSPNQEVRGRPRFARNAANAANAANAPNVANAANVEIKNLKAEGLTLAPPAVNDNPLGDKLDVTQVVSGDGSLDRRFVVINLDGVELVLRPGKETRDGAGKPIPALAGWKLTFVCDNFALFSNGNEDAGFLVPRPGR